MSVTERRQGREGLSVQMLVVAAVASAAAAIVTSTFWRGGTIVTAAMTPVIVAIVKELLARPLDSEVVRRPVARVRSVAPPTVAVRRFERPREARMPVEAGRARRDVPHGGARATHPARPRAATAPVTETPDSPTPGPIKTYGRRRLRLGAAIATGVVAFVVALVALTVPELIFGGSVAGKGDTTLFGGRTEKTTTSPTQTSTTQTSTSSTTTSPQGQTHTSTTPSQTSPSEQSPPKAQQPPSTQQAPGGGSSPSPSSPSGGAAPPK